MSETVTAIITADTSRFQSEMQNIQNNLSTFGKTVGALGASMTAAITVPLTNIAKEAINMSSTFETGLAKVSTLLSDTAIVQDEYFSGLIGLSNKVGQSLDIVTEALYQSLSSGVAAGDAMGFLETAVKAAVAGFTDAETAVDGLTSVLNAYGLTAADAERITSEMIIAQNLGKTTFGEMAASIAHVTPIAAALGVETKEVFSALATLTANGISTSQAMTYIKSSMSTIFKPTATATKMAKALGIEFDANAIKANGYSNTIRAAADAVRNQVPAYAALIEKQASLDVQMKTLADTTGTASDEYAALKQEAKAVEGQLALLEKTQGDEILGLSQLFGNVESLNAVLIQTSEQGIELFDKSMEAMSDTTGVLDQAFNTMNNTTAAQFDQAMTRMKNALIGFGDMLKPIMTGIMNAISGVVEWIGNLDNGWKGVIITVGAVVAAMGPILTIMGGAILIGGALTSSMAALGITFAGTIAPILAVIAAITAVVAAFVYAYNTSDTFRDGVNNCWNAIKTVISTVTKAISSIIKDVFGFIKQFLHDNSENIKSIFQNAWTIISALFSSVTKVIKDIVTVVFTAIKNFWSDWGDTIIKYFDNMWKVIKQTLQSALDIITGIFNVFVGLFTGNWQQCWDGAKQIFVGVWEFIKTFISATLDTLVSVFGSIFTTILGVIERFGTSAYNTIKGAVDKIAKTPEAISKGFKTMCDNVKDFVGKTLDAITALPRKIMDAFKNFKLPRIELEFGSKTFFGKEISYPKGFNISWHADGGIFTQPTVIGNHGFGEAGKEAILPLRKLPDLLRLDDIFNALDNPQQQQPTIGNGNIVMQMVMNDEVLAEQLFPIIDFLQAKQIRFNAFGSGVR